MYRSGQQVPVLTVNHAQVSRNETTVSWVPDLIAASSCDPDPAESGDRNVGLNDDAIIGAAGAVSDDAVNSITDAPGAISDLHIRGLSKSDHVFLPSKAQMRSKKGVFTCIQCVLTSPI